MNLILYSRLANFHIKIKEAFDCIGAKNSRFKYVHFANIKFICSYRSLLLYFFNYLLKKILITYKKNYLLLLEGTIS